VELEQDLQQQQVEMVALVAVLVVELLLETVQVVALEIHLL
tara:strand:+ start:221 stop:343 length:123 start_codon:yes stop_codon:yes gene_type:complete